MTASPLRRDPTRPELDKTGRLTNPIGTSPFVNLDPDAALTYGDLTTETTYLDQRFEYLTDGHAMPARARGVLRLRPRSAAPRHPNAQAAVGRLGTADSRWHGGHIVAVTLGGYGSGPNLFPQSANFNQSAFARLENGWRQALAEGVEVAVDIALSSGEHPHVPEFVLATYWEDGEVVDTIPLLNEPYVQ
ncbi:MAG: DNA/RNA non-specific endonuclease [Acidimicrobiales bacterium]